MNFANALQLCDAMRENTAFFLERCKPLAVDEDNAKERMQEMADTILRDLQRLRLRLLFFRGYAGNDGGTQINPDMNATLGLIEMKYALFKHYLANSLKTNVVIAEGAQAFFDSLADN